ncbi:hypothetical protein [Rubritepida flocculans]|uniref:hypothetical protein n=1 Tax=Rubritepida flocculans TaxID=182403 RepID=UPI00040C04D9|nr:hypothetical protein [Rubritepida flocculans]
MTEAPRTALEGFNTHPLVVALSRVAAPLMLALMLWVASFVWDIDRRVLVLEQHRVSEQARVSERLIEMARTLERVEARMARMEERALRSAARAE